MLTLSINIAYADNRVTQWTVLCSALFPCFSHELGLLSLVIINVIPAFTQAEKQRSERDVADHQCKRHSDSDT